MPESGTAERTRRQATARFAVHGVEPDRVEMPASAAEAADLLRDASSNATSVECAGAGGWLSWGRPPDRLERVVSAAALAGITDYEPADLVLSAGAGTTLDELRGAVAAENQALPFDAPASPGATIGATVALAAAGPLRAAWGTPRDQVLGLDVVTGDGRLLRLGGRVVKNVAGYDLVRLMVGSHGTLGLITAVHVRLRPAPARDATFVAFAARADALLEFARETVRPLLPAALELLAPETARAIGLAEPAWALLGRFHGNASAVADAVARTERAGAPYRTAFLDATAAAVAWSSLSRMETTAHLLARVSGPPASLLETVHAAVAGTADDDVLRSIGDPSTAPRSGWHLAAHLVDGIVRLWADDAAVPDPERCAATLIDARARVERTGGALRLAVGPRDLTKHIDPFGDWGPASRLMRELKRTFDPAGILSAGRYVT